jgi:hypothetical protein
MNPYDFARIDWNKPPQRRKPIWHHQLVGGGNQRLYSGHINIDVYAETPVFIADPRNVSPDPKKPAQFMQNKQGDYIIPGSSLKGLLRCVVETLGNGCLTLFDGQYERGKVNYRWGVPDSFQHCDTTTELCITCRTFGMLKERTSGVFQGKVNISDARSYPDKIYKYEPMYTAVLVEPKPRHRSFYLDPTEKHIAGRKFYFHHSPEVKPLTASGPILFSGKPANRYIQPLDYDTQFHFRIDFTNLETDEFAALMLAIVLEDGMRHKIGYGKPLGLGSISLAPTSLTLIDYAARYTQSTSDQGKTTLQGEAMWNFLDDHIDSFSKKHLLQKIAMDDLRRIWHWKPDPDIDYHYPSKRDWFDTEGSRGKRIADTKNVP